ncbi:MAG: tetratricopeptide repeat protein [Ignavibacteria bacterium]|nr:tetratricopeptide repeat protein [Ignavibacteria bacterium]
MKEIAERKRTEVEESKEKSKFQLFVEQNQKAINIGALGIIVLVILVFVVRYFVSKSEEEKERKASVAISRILPFIENAEYEMALKGDKTRKVRGEEIIGLVDIVKKYKGVPQSYVAAVYAGNCYLQLEKYKDAIEYFKIALDSKSAIVLEGASAGLGVCYENMKNYNEAAKYYEMASNYALPIGIKDRYLYFQALCLEKVGDKKKAEKLFRTIIGNNQSEFVGLAKAGLIRLGTIIE